MNRFLNALGWVAMCTGFAFAFAFVVIDTAVRSQTFQQFLLDYGYQLTILFMFFALGISRLEKLLEQAPPETLHRDGVIMTFVGFVVLLGCAFAAGTGEWTQLFFLWWVTFALFGAAAVICGIGFFRTGQAQKC